MQIYYQFPLPTSSLAMAWSSDILHSSLIWINESTWYGCWLIICIMLSESIDSTAAKNLCCNWRYVALCSNTNHCTPFVLFKWHNGLRPLADESDSVDFVESIAIEMPIFDGAGQLSFGVTNHVALNGRPRPLRRSFELFKKRFFIDF